MAPDTGAAVLSPETLKKCPKNKGRKSALFPIALIGGRDIRPQARVLDPELRRAILETETHLLPDNDLSLVPLSASSKITTCTADTYADPGPIPEFLRRRP
jgi:hypothetical protein